MISLSNLLKQQYVIQLENDARIINGDERFVQGGYTRVAVSNDMAPSSEEIIDGFLAGLDAETVQVEPEVTAEEILQQAQTEADGIDHPANAVRRNLAADDACNAIELCLAVVLRLIRSKRNLRTSIKERRGRANDRLTAAIAAAAVIIEHDLIHRLIPHLFPVSFSLTRMSI